MKNVIIVFLLLTSVLVNSCKDKNNEPNGFQPSLNLEEYVLINVNGIERLFTSENSIRVKERINNDGSKNIFISLFPNNQNLSHFHLEINEPIVGDFTTEQLEINYSDYSNTNEFPAINLNCSSSECDGGINVTIHELGTVGEKMIGEMSGTITTNVETSQFVGEFVVYIDQ